MTRPARTTGSTLRSPGKVLSSLTVAAALSRRDQILIIVSVVIITLLAWIYLIEIDHRMKPGTEDAQAMAAMAAMGMPVSGGWTAADALFAFVMWSVMMIGMMAPAAIPLLLLFASAETKRNKRGAWFLVLMFGFGYAAVWTGFSAGAALVQWLLQQIAMLTTALQAASPRLSGGILLAVGISQLTPWKSTCLTHCRSPLGFLMTNWRDGTLGAFRMGLNHGVYCLGCCWALMCVLFVVGVMNLLWVAALTIFVLLEKVGPAGTTVARIAGVAMILVGAFKLI
jgi:predicted metal-binding membrane protein